MVLRTDYPYQEAINDLKKLVDKYVLHQNVKEEFEEIFQSSLERNGSDAFYPYKVDYIFQGIPTE